MTPRVPLKIRAKIRELSRNGKKILELMEEYHLSQSTIKRIIKEGRTRPKKRGRPPKLTKCERRQLLRYVESNPTASAKSIAQAVGLSVSKRTVQRELQRNQYHHEKVRISEHLTPIHMQKRLDFARKNVSKSLAEWKKVIFTDEKKWNLIGNDGYVSAWTRGKFSYSRVAASNLRKGLMVWGAISASKGMRLVCIEEKITAQTYIDVLENDFFNVVKDDLPVGFVFQQDNAPPHSAAVTKEYLKNKKIEVLEWPPMSPDLSPIENIWGIMSQKVYEGGKTYQNVNDLWDAIVLAWLQIPPEVFSHLYESMTTRMIKILEGGGKRIKF